MIMMNATAVMSDANIMMKSGYYIMVLLRIDEMQIVVRNLFLPRSVSSNVTRIL